uniref:Uncharacterized protein n=1 Tax=Trichogramma kaykai TaxID=54128 RepID=A0ABD2WG52_9HYME
MALLCIDILDVLFGFVDACSLRTAKEVLWAERASAELRRRDRSAEFPLFLEEEIEAKPLLREEFGDIYQKYETEHFWELLTFGELLEKIKENGILPIQNSYFTWRDIRNVFQHYNKKIYKKCQKQRH